MIESATAKPRSPVSCTVTARGIEVIQDKPAEYGGTNAGLMASEHLLVGLLACQLSTFYKVAKKRKSAAEAISLDGALHFDDNDDIERVHLAWRIRGDPGEFGTLLRLTDKICTISKVLNVPITYEANAS